MTTEQIEKLRGDVSHIRVIPLDMDKLTADITESIRKNDLDSRYDENDSFYLNEKFAIIKGTNISIDTECYGELDGTISLNVHKKRTEGDKKSLDMIPVVITSTPLDIALSNYAMTEIDLPTFMGDRFGYNSRIESNIRGIIDEVESYKKAQEYIN